MELDASELDEWRDEVVEELDLTEPVDVDYDPLARFQTPVPAWMLREGKPCVAMVEEIGLEETLEFFYGTHTWQQAKTLCSKCPDREDCLEYANKYNEEGVWGATSYPERKRAKKIRDKNKENA